MSRSIYLFINSLTIILNAGRGFNLYSTELYFQPAPGRGIAGSASGRVNGSYFGLSLSFYRQGSGEPYQLLVGAPHDALVSLEPHPTYTGRMFACGLEQAVQGSQSRSSNPSRASITSSCLPQSSLISPDKTSASVKNSENVAEFNQQLGFTMESLITRDFSIGVVCGHKSSFYHSSKNRTFSIGTCFADWSGKRPDSAPIQLSRKRRDTKMSVIALEKPGEIQRKTPEDFTNNIEENRKTILDHGAQMKSSESIGNFKMEENPKVDYNKAFDSKAIESYDSRLERMRRGSDEIDFNGDWRRITPLLSHPEDLLEKDYSGRYTYGQTVIKLAYTQYGTSLHITRKGHVVMGSPGVWFWSGGVYIWKGEENTSCQLNTTSNNADDYDYLGYSVTSTTMKKRHRPVDEEVEIYISGEPRWNYTGRVLLFEVAWSKCQMIVIQTLSVSEAQMGSYYGWSTLVQDINGDGLGDLFVGAPFFNQSSGDEGAVFVYMRITNELGDPRQYPMHHTLMLGTGLSQGARFGTCIASAGDINLDGFNDIVIGAPFDDDGIGSVYLYMGGVKGLRVEHGFVQKFKPTPSDIGIRSFGFTISSHPADVDNNAYPDLAVGAFMSETVTLIRTRPVHTVTVDIEFSAPFVTWPHPHCSTGRHPDGMTEYDVTVTFHYNVPARQMSSGAALLSHDGKFLTDQAIALIFLDRSDLQLGVSVRRCLAVEWANVTEDCVSFELMEKSGYYIGVEQDRVKVVKCGSENTADHREGCSFISRMNHFKNGTFSFELVSRRNQFLSCNSTGHLTLQSVKESQASLASATFYLQPSQTFQGLSGISYNLTVDTLTTSQGKLPSTQLVHQGRYVSNITGELDFSVADLLKPKSVTWRAAYTNVTRNVLAPPLTPVLYEIKMKQRNNGANQFDHNSKATVQTPLLNKLASSHFYKQMELFSPCGTDYICQPQVTVQLFDNEAAAVASTVVSTKASATANFSLAGNLGVYNASPIIVGDTQPISLFVVFYNDGEPADHLDLIVRHPIGLRYRHVQAVDCPGRTVTCLMSSVRTKMAVGSNDDTGARANSNESEAQSGFSDADDQRESVGELQCELSQPLYGNVSLTIQIDFEPIDETYEPRVEPVTFSTTAIARTDHANHTITAKNLTRSIKYDGKLDIYSDLSSEDAVTYDPTGQAPVTVSHLYTVISVGPGVSPRVNISVHVPLCPYPDSSITESLNVTVKYNGVQLTAAGEETVLQSKHDASDGPLRVKRSPAGNKTAGEKKSGITILKCLTDSNSTKVKEYHIGSMNAKSEVQILISLRLITKKLIDASWKEVRVSVESLVEAVPASTTHYYHDVQSTDEAKFSVSKTLKTLVRPAVDSSPMSPLIMASMGFGIGFLFLLILLLILYKCGFFRRHRGADLLKEEQEAEAVDETDKDLLPGMVVGNDADNDSATTGEKPSLDRSLYDIPDEQNNYEVYDKSDDNKSFVAQ